MEPEAVFLAMFSHCFTYPHTGGPVDPGAVFLALFSCDPWTSKMCLMASWTLGYKDLRRLRKPEWADDASSVICNQLIPHIQMIFLNDASVMIN